MVRDKGSHGINLMNHLQLPDRMVSLDALRGAAIAGMILVNNPGRWSKVYAQLRHSPWHGWTFADCVFPMFLFILGVSTVFSLSRQKAASQGNPEAVLKILRRTSILFLLGLLLNGFPDYTLHNLRIPGVLQRIALCYLAASLITLKTQISTQVFLLLTILVSYALVLMYVPVPGLGAACLDLEANIVSYVDGLLLRNHLWYNHHSFDPEGILSTVSAIGSTLTGVLTGHWLMSHRSMMQKTTWMAGAGMALMACGQVWSLWLPINKAIWTSSYAVFMAGVSLVSLAFFVWLIDVKGWRKGATPFVVLGINAITAYVLSELLAKTLKHIEVTNSEGVRTNLRSFIFLNFYQPLTSSSKAASLLFALTVLLVVFLVAWVMWKKRWMLKIG